MFRFKNIFSFLSNSKVQFFLLILGVFSYIYISRYIHPAGDDFSYSVKTWDISFFQTYVGEYCHHNGRYASNFLVLINPLSYYNIVAYKLAPFILLLLVTLSLTVFFRSLFSGSPGKLKLISLAVLTVLLLLSGMPELAEGIYWFTGSVSYTAGYIFVLLYASLALYLIQKKYLLSSRVVHHALTILCLFIVCGFNETLTTFVFVIHLGVMVYLFAREKKVSPLILLYTLLAFSFLSLMFFAPGNGERASEYPVKYDLSGSLLTSSLYALRFVSAWLSEASLWFYSVLLLPMLGKIIEKKRLYHPVFKIHPLLIFGFLVFLVFISAFLPCYGTGMLGQQRTINTAWFFFIMGWLAMLISISYRIQEHRSTIQTLYKRFHLYIKVCLLFTLFFSGNSYTVLNDIRSGAAVEFDKEMFDRYKRIQLCIALEDEICDIPYLKNKPGSIFVYDIQPDPHHWLNRCYLVYYRKQEMLLKEY